MNYQPLNILQKPFEYSASLLLISIHLNWQIWYFF